MDPRSYLRSVDPARAAAAFVVVLGAVGAAAGLLIAALAFEPIPFDDAIDFLHRFHEVGGWNGFGFAELYERHNEHRLVVPRLWFLADLAWFDGTQWFLILVTLLSAAAHAVLLSLVFRELGHRGPLAWAFAAAAVGAMLSPVQWENFVWGFQVQFVQVWLFATLAFAALASAAARQSWALLGLALAAALCSTYSMANGILVWPLLAALGMWAGLRGGRLWLLLAVAAAVVALEIAGYHARPGHGDPMQAVADPLLLVRFAGRYLTSAISNLRHAYAEVLAVVLVVALVAMAIDAVLRHDRYRTAHAVLLAVAGFVIGAALLTAMGRAVFGLDQATTGRYTTPSLVFLLAVFALLLDRLARLGSRAWQGVLLAVTGGALLLPGLVHGVHTWPIADARRDARVNAVSAYVAGGYRPATLAPLYPIWPPHPFVELQQMEVARLGPFAWPERFAPPSRLLEGPVPAAGSLCRGHIDGAVSDVVAGLDVSGWLAAEDSAEQPEWILVADQGGTVAAWGGSLVQRLDVGNVLRVGRAGRGFRAVGRRPAAGPLTVTGVFADGRLCRLPQPAVPSSRFLPALPVGARPATDAAWQVLEGTGTDRIAGPPPPGAAPAIGTIGHESHLVARIAVPPAGDAAVLAVPLRTGDFPLGVSVVVRRADDGAELDRHDFRRGMTRQWVWRLFPATAAIPDLAIVVEVLADGPNEWQGIAVGRPHWIGRQATASGQ